MRKLQAVHPDDQMKLMEQLTQELQPILQSSTDPQIKEAQKVFLGTLYQLTLKIFDWLPPEQQSEILTACGTWFDIGLLMGNAPLKLVDVIRNVKPRLIDTDIPEWVSRQPAPE